MIRVIEVRDGLRVTGTDAAKYLHSQLSNDIASLGTGESRYAFALDPNGKVVALCRVTRLAADDFLVDADRGAGEALLARLLRFRIRVDANFESVVVTAHCTRGESAEISSDTSAPPGAIGVPAWWGDGSARDHLVIGRSDESSAEDEMATLEEFRVRARWPRHGAEIVSGETLPAATGVVPVSVSFTKGCYPGQELVERMDSRGATSPYVLCSVPAAGRSPGDPYVVDGVEVGTVTSVAGNAALAYVKRDFAT